MKRKLFALSRRYRAALQAYLKQGGGPCPSPARRLGEETVALGLETVALSRIHQAALATLVLPDSLSATRSRVTRQAEIFLAEARLAIEKTPRAGASSTAQLNRQNKLLTQRAAKLVATNRRLERGLAEHKTAEEAFKKSGRHDAKALQESHQLQKHLRHLTHQLLSAQEVERTKISHELHDEVAQTLLGIHVRLLTLKKAAQGNTAHLRKVIASTQRAVKESIQSINRFVHELDIQQPA